MKFKLVSSMILLSGLLITSCGPTSEQKVEDAKDALEEANESYLKEMENYKAEKWAIINENDVEIAKIRANNSKNYSEEYNDLITILEEKNEALKVKLSEYSEEGESKWKSFKKEFNQDMDELGLAFKNIFKKNN